MTRQLSATTEAASIAGLAATEWRIVARRQQTDPNWHYTIPLPSVKAYQGMVEDGVATSVQRRTGPFVELLAKLVAVKHPAGA